jgi:hypothetical protein
MHEPILHTYKSIARFMGMSVTTLKRKHKRSKRTSDPMPLIPDGTIKAIPEDLRDWLRRQSWNNFCNDKKNTP